MPSQWAEWDAKVEATGRPNVVAEQLNDLEILNMLADPDPDRTTEKRVLRQEAYRRMSVSHQTPPQDSERPHAEPDTGAFDADRYSRLPSHRDYRDAS